MKCYQRILMLSPMSSFKSYTFLIALVFTTSCLTNESKQKKTISKLSKSNNDTIRTTISHPEFSGVGFLKCNSDRLFLIDEYFCRIHEFDENLNYIQSHLDIGKGPNEIPSIQMVSFSDKQIAVMEKTWRLHIYSKSWIKIKTLQFNFDTNTPYQESLKNPKPTDIGIYEIEYTHKQMQILNDSILLIHIISDHPEFNSFFSPTYYKMAKTMALLNLNTGKIQNLLTPYPEIYQQYNFIPNFKYSYSSKIEDFIYYSFEADPNIYRININSQVKDTFSCPTSYQIPMKYPETKTFESAEENYNMHRKNYPYYGTMQPLSNKHNIARIYHTGKGKSFDVLQIIETKPIVTVQELSIPKNLYLSGVLKGNLVLASTEENDKPGIDILIIPLQPMRK